MSYQLKFGAVVLALGMALAGNIFGQAAAMNGEITGTITDPAGAAISGATVQINNVDTGFKQSAKTSETGLYRFAVLPLGTYEITGSRRASALPSALESR